MHNDTIRNTLRNIVVTACKDNPARPSFVVKDGQFVLTVTGNRAGWEALCHEMGVPANAYQTITGDTLQCRWESLADHYFGASGVLSTILPGYEVREGQIHGARLFQRAIEMNDVALVEAGTGVGKSMLYLVIAMAMGKKVVVSTSNKMLQSQLMKKDIPFLIDSIFHTKTFALAQGKNNFACKLKAEGETEILHPQLRKWYEETQTGNLEEINFEVSHHVLNEIRLDDSCLKNMCPLIGECFYYRNKEARKHADVVVCNHTLLTMHSMYPGAGILPEYDVLVVDEAHALPEYMRLAVGNEMTVGGITRVIERGRGEDSFAQASLKLEKFDQELRNFASNGKFDIGVPSNHVFATVAPLVNEIRNLADNVMKEGEEPSTPEERKAANYAETLRNLASRLAHFTGPTKGGWVRWVNAGGKELSFVASPHDVSWLAKSVMKLDEAGYPEAPVLFTSATLAAPTFNGFKRDMGIPFALEMKVDSPFDYKSNAVLYVPDAASPAPDDAGWADFVVDLVTRLVYAAEGGSLLLFSSNKMMKYAHDALWAKFSKEGYLVMLQGELPKLEIVDRMRRNSNTVVFATQGFYEGVDVQGENLRLTFIDRIPFEAPSPLLDAQENAVKLRGGNPFDELRLPRAIIKAKQAFGRLIRTQEDYGVVAIADTRIRTKKYGRESIKPSLPPARYVSESTSASDFLHQRRHKKSAVVKLGMLEPVVQFGVQGGHFDSLWGE